MKNYETVSKKDPLMDKRNLPVKVNTQAQQLPPPGPETCIACRILKNLNIRNFKSFPGNCPALQHNFWCTLLHLKE